MASKKNKNQSKGQKAAAKATPPMRRLVRSALDRTQQAYYKLLVDPCNAPLAYPVFGGSDGTYLAKFEAFLTIGDSLQNGYLWWSPGTDSTTARSCLVGGGAAAPSTSLVWSTGTTDYSAQEPGYVFLRTSGNVANYRAIAACAEVMTLDSELNRQGMLSVGTVSNGAVYGLDSSVDQLMPLTNSTGRMPSGKVEAVWRPSEADVMFTDPSDTVAAQQVDRRNGLLICWAGASATTKGLRVKLTLVAEWKPKRGSGLTVPSPTTAQSTAGYSSVATFMARNADAFIRWAPMVGGIAYSLTNSARGPAYGGM